MISTTMVAYSRAHFDPNGRAAVHRVSSAGVLAETVYAAAVAVSDRVIYVDAQDRSDWPNDEDITSLIGIESSFVELTRRYRPKHSMLFAVNQEARASIDKWLRPVAAGKMPSTAILGSYDIHSRDPRAAALADQVLLVGDTRTYGTYLQRRDPRALHVTAYGYGVAGATEYPQTPTILFPASAIGVRKGIDFVDAVCSRILDRAITEFQVVVMGEAVNQYWKRTLETWGNSYPGIFRHPGWLSSSQDEYRRIMSSPTCAVVPSREEGMVGMAVELLNVGIPVFSTIECGLGPRSTRFVLMEGQESLWADQVIDFCLEEHYSKAALACSDVIAANTDAVGKAVRRFLETGDARPKVWVKAAGNSITLRRSESAGALEYGLWIKHQSTDETSTAVVDGVVFGVQTLESRPDLQEVRLCKVGLDEMPDSRNVMGSASPDMITYLASDGEAPSSRMSLLVSSARIARASRSGSRRVLRYRVTIIRLYALHIAARVRPYRRWASKARRQLVYRRVCS